MPGKCAVPGRTTFEDREQLVVVGIVNRRNRGLAKAAKVVANHPVVRGKPLPLRIPHAGIDNSGVKMDDGGTRSGTLRVELGAVQVE
jgi:hypothetical protein